ncbi:putative nuclease HARBI1 [Tribolium madens]|uniref:putative nuclease HARBI1 n=1 Tax=Tribolium madens TaxID=41895 RepID=UPI001CF74923|nr:putative nuclease HARBI1 [Tribolium madens]
MEQLLVGVLTDNEDIVELLNITRRKRARKVFRLRENHFTKWNDKEFIKRFRLSKNGVRFVLDRISEEIAHPTQSGTYVVTLRFYATGSFLQVVANFSGIGHRVSWAIARLETIFIKLPNTNQEMQCNSKEFYNTARFPKCIGALDCTHIKIMSPGGDQAEIFRNRKGFFSMNVQAICDTHAKIQDIVCRWPGSAHDSTIFNNSSIRQKFENRDFENYVLVGDSGYAVRPFLITPLGATATRAENLFNECQIRTRNPIERCFGIWKRRFPALAFGIRLQRHKVEAIVVATAVLHNMACLLNEELPPINPEEEAAVQFVNDVGNEIVRENNIGGVNNSVRHQLIHDYFNRLL